MTRVTQSFTRQIAEGTGASCFRSIAPIVFATAELSAAGLLGVVGSMPYQYGDGEDDVTQLDFETRWVTIPMAAGKELLETAMKDGTINTIRIPSRVAGNQYGIGSEEALLLQLTGSKEAKALAEKYHLDYSETVPVGADEIEVTHVNPIAISLGAACEILGLLQFPTLEKAQGRVSRADTSNPDFFAALAYADANEGKLPPRERANRSARIDKSFSSRFPQRENFGRRYQNSRQMATVNDI